MAIRIASFCIRTVFAVGFLGALVYGFLLWRQGLLLHSGMSLLIGIGIFMICGVALVVLKKLSAKTGKDERA